MAGAKTNENEQWGLASSTGARPAPFATLAAGDGGAPLITPESHVWVRDGGAGPAGYPTPWQDRSAALVGLEGVNTPTLIQLLECITGQVVAPSDSEVNYAQLYNSAAPPGALTVPEWTVRIVGSQAFAWSPSGGWRFTAGIFFALSTTPIGFTAPATAVAWWNATGFQP